MSRTREELHQAFGDELRGLLMESFAEAHRTGLTAHSANGLMMFKQLVRAKELLDKIHAFYGQQPAGALAASGIKKATNGDGARAAPAKRT